MRAGDGWAAFCQSMRAISIPRRLSAFIALYKTGSGRQALGGDQLCPSFIERNYSNETLLYQQTQNERTPTQ